MFFLLFLKFAVTFDLLCISYIHKKHILFYFSPFIFFLVPSFLRSVEKVIKLAMKMSNETPFLVFILYSC